MTQLWLVRHGQTDWNLEGRYQGQSNTGLNDTGRAQARAVAQRLCGEPIDVVYSSDLARACETARILADELDLPVIFDRRLREICLGTWEGMLYNDINRQFPAEVELRCLHQRDYRVPNGETPAEVAVRMSLAARDITRANPHGNVLVVSHGLALAALYCLANDISLETVFEHLPPNAEPRLIRWSADGGRGK